MYKRCFVEIKVGDIYIRHSDGKICRVKKIDHKIVVLEFYGEGRTWLGLTDVFGLEKGYSKREYKPTQQSP
jgi:hypothetical protein